MGQAAAFILQLLKPKDAFAIGGRGVRPICGVVASGHLCAFFSRLNIALSIAGLRMHQDLGNIAHTIFSDLVARDLRHLGHAYECTLPLRNM